MYLHEQDSVPAPKSGLVILQSLVLCMFVLFALRFWFLQIHKSEYFVKLAQVNTQRKELIDAPRGQIKDRKGRLLAINQPSYVLTLVREDCKDLEATLEQVGKWTGVPLDVLEKRVEAGRKQVKSFEGLVLVSDLSFAQVATIEANAVLWPGLEIIVRQRRVYPNGRLMAHIIGYLGEADEKVLERDKELRPGDMAGRQGLELVLEKNLRGKKGLEEYEVDATERHLDKWTLRHPLSGNDISLSLDLDLQRFVHEQMEGNAGGVVVLDPDTGQVLALVSEPTYNNNVFTGRLSEQQWYALNDHPRHPLQNRVIQNEYPPGSVWKLMVAACALQNGVINEHTRVNCPGFYKIGRAVFRCWKKSGHGPVNVKEAIVHSCDVFFYYVGEKLGVDKISKYAFACGFGNPTGIDLPNEKGGRVPTRQWKRKRFKEPWVGGDNLNLAIGQGFTLAQPLQVARFIGALLNGGKLMKPNLLLDETPQVQGRIPLKEEYRKLILDAMEETVQSGTGRVLKRPDARMGGKTGTAQVVRVGKKRKKKHEMPYMHRDHAWLASWGEKDGKRYVVVCMVEHGGHGGSTSGPIVKAIFEYLFGKPVDPEKKNKVAGSQ